MVRKKRRRRITMERKGKSTTKEMGSLKEALSVKN